ncbi:hypothetical protein RHSIM_Rhsim08G0158400 [Rhododendron simsii]|uniref:Uncharacterized protein n=1 Tax=Rhododendron simsii TaxID=118357 RepID=A0A834GGI4_RHOSS|nr:hypothetical protein RHSIM_Rhsim08G0158400 [Rhododendron simsii]
MDESVKDQSSAPANTEKSSSSSTKLRYPLRSATKPKEEKPWAAELSNPSVPKRGRLASTVSKSVSVLDVSGKDKSGKPPRRLSIPSKSTTSPVPRSVGIITPISEARAKRSDNSQTPLSDVSKLSNRRKFNVLSSASYWLSQIKLSESAAQHTVSLGFFKLAFEAGCEPLQRMKDELNSYAQRHSLAELGEKAKELFEGYNMLENFEQLQVSETCSQVHKEGTQSSDDDVHSSSSTTGPRKLKPKSLNNYSTAQASPVIGSAKKDAVKKDNPGIRTRGSMLKNSANAKAGTEVAGRTISKASQKPSKQELNQEKDKIKKQGKKTICEQSPVNPLSTEEPLQENKENMEDAPQMEKISVIEV